MHEVDLYTSKYGTFKLVMSVYNLIATGCLKAKEQISNPTKLQ